MTRTPAWARVPTTPSMTVQLQTPTCGSGWHWPSTCWNAAQLKVRRIVRIRPSWRCW